MPPGLRETVFTFTNGLIRGYYKEAHTDQSREQVARARAPVRYVRVGLTSQDEFVDALDRECASTNRSERRHNGTC